MLRLSWSYPVPRRVWRYAQPSFARGCRFNKHNVSVRELTYPCRSKFWSTPSGKRGSALDFVGYLNFLDWIATHMLTSRHSLSACLELRYNLGTSTTDYNFAFVTDALHFCQSVIILLQPCRRCSLEESAAPHASEHLQRRS